MASKAEPHSTTASVGLGGALTGLFIIEAQRFGWNMGADEALYVSTVLTAALGYFFRWLITRNPELATEPQEAPKP